MQKRAGRIVYLLILFSTFVFGILHFTDVTAQSSCPNKSRGDADCQSDGNGKAITLADYQIWRSEYLAACSAAAPSACGTDADSDGNAMDANFDSDTNVTLSDYQVWRTGYLGSGTNPTATPTQPSNPTPTTDPNITITPRPAGAGIWISKEEIAALPASGAAWDNLKSAADASFGSSALYNQDSKHPQYALAAALVATKQGDSATCGGQNCKAKAAAAIMDILDDTGSTGGGDGRILALGRNLASYVIAADVMDFASYNPSQEQQFRAFITRKLTEGGHPGACDSLVQCHGKRPENWGTMAGASRIAIDLYTNNQSDLAEAVKVFKGFLGDRASYDGFAFGSGAELYTCSTPLIAINADCSRTTPNCSTTFNMSGAVIDDVRRDLDNGASCPPESNYAWGGYSGVLAQAEMLHRAGHPAYDWQNQAIKRGMDFLFRVMPGSQSGATEWVPWVVKHHYGGSYQTKSGIGWGRLVHFTDWTHQ